MNDVPGYLEPSKLRAASSIPEKMIKTDHAGENGAVNIYRAQKIGASIRARSLLPQLSEFQSHEEEHRRIFQGHLTSVGVRRCVSYHLCGAGGFALGFVTGLIGPKAIAATTYAVEHVVLEHLEEQLSYLKGRDQAAFECVHRIYADEKEHHDSAESMFDLNGPLTRLLIKIVKFSTEWVIRIGMR